MTLAIARHEGDRAVLCLLVEWRPPFSPDAATAEASNVLTEYGLSDVVGDHYAGDWPKDHFRAHSIRYETADKTKSDYYQALLPLINGGLVEPLERATSWVGKEPISRTPGWHDDLIRAEVAATPGSLGFWVRACLRERSAQTLRRPAPRPKSGNEDSEKVPLAFIDNLIRAHQQQRRRRDRQAEGPGRAKVDDEPIFASCSMG